MIRYPRGKDYYDDLAARLTVQGYWDFPVTMAAFGESLSTSTLNEMDGVFFRWRGKQVTVITWYDPSAVQRLWEQWTRLGFKVKVLGQSPELGKDLGDFGRRKVENEFYAPTGWSWDGVLDSKSGKTRRTWGNRIRNRRRRWAVRDATIPEALWMEDKWAAWARQRHFMVRRGHHQRYIRQSAFGHSRLMGVYENGAIIGLSGYEIFQGTGQITVVKHLPGSGLAQYVWICTLERCFDEGARVVYCGSAKRARGIKAFVGCIGASAYKVLLGEAADD